MKFYRFMSFKEFKKMSIGVEVVGKRFPENRTNSDGICFIAETTVFDSEPYGDEPGTYAFNPIDCYQFLRGIVSNEVLVEFEAKIQLTSSWGVYADPFGGWDDLISIDEYCIPSYNRETMIPLRYNVDFSEDENQERWYTFN